MEMHDLPFVQLIKLAPDLVEAIVADGVEMDSAMVAQYHDWIRQHMADPCLVLVNKRNAYSYTFDAQREIGTIPQIKAIAFLTYSPISDVATENLAEFPRSKPWRTHIFHDRDEALAWLVAQRD